MEPTVVYLDDIRAAFFAATEDEVVLSYARNDGRFRDITVTLVDGALVVTENHIKDLNS